MGKFALRGLAQSMARELSPKGLHIAHFVIDGGIGKDGGDAKLDPDEIAKTYLSVYRQQRSAWTWEVELRPWVERFLKFVYNGLPMRVVFGAGSLSQLPAELERLGAKRALLLSTPEQRESLQQVAKTLGCALRGHLRQGGDARAARNRRGRAAHGARARRRLLRHRRRRLDHRPRQGDRAHFADADPRSADHLRRFRDDADLRHHRGRREEDRARPARAAEGRDLRPRAHAQPAARAFRLERHERDRAFGGGAVCAGREPGDLADGRGRYPRIGEGSAFHSQNPGRI